MKDYLNYLLLEIIESKVTDGNIQLSNTNKYSNLLIYLLSLLNIKISYILQKKFITRCVNND